MPSTVTAKPFCGPSPAVSTHTTVEEDTHAVVAQLVNPSRIDGVTSNDPKLIPDTVALCPAEVAALSSETKLTKGAAHEKHQNHVGRSLAHHTCTSLQYRGARRGSYMANQGKLKQNQSSSADRRS